MIRTVGGCGVIDQDRVAAVAVGSNLGEDVDYCGGANDFVGEAESVEAASHPSLDVLPLSFVLSRGCHCVSNSYHASSLHSFDPYDSLTRPNSGSGNNGLASNRSHSAGHPRVSPCWLHVCFVRSFAQAAQCTRIAILIGFQLFSSCIDKDGKLRKS